MSQRIRFSSARSVFDAFDDLKLFASEPADAQDPLDHARALLASPRPGEATAFLAHLLPRREAVWWARKCVETILGPTCEDAAFKAASDWVRSPDEAHRRAALGLGSNGDQRLPTTWLALAAGWSGGSLIDDPQHTIQPPSSSCAKAANAAVVVAAQGTGVATMAPWLVACAEAGVRFADGEEARVEPPPASFGPPR